MAAAGMDYEGTLPVSYTHLDVYKRQDMFHDPDMDYNKIRAYRRKIMEEHLEKVGIELKPGAIEILTYLKEKGLSLIHI